MCVDTCKVFSSVIFRRFSNQRPGEPDGRLLQQVPWRHTEVTGSAQQGIPVRECAIRAVEDKIAPESLTLAYAPGAAASPEALVPD